jgi:predicted nuclease of predicted toxin-antitoxin system
MNPRPGARLLLDEMFSPAIAAELRQLGHDVIAVADRPDLRSKSDDETFAWTSAEKRWLLTQNVKDFRPIMLRALPAGTPGCGLLFISSRAFPGPGRIPAR